MPHPNRVRSAAPTLLALFGIAAGVLFSSITGYFADLPLPPLPAVFTPAALLRAFLLWFMRGAGPLLLLYFSGFSCFAWPCAAITVSFLGFLYGTLTARLAFPAFAAAAICACEAFSLLLAVNVCRLSLLHAAHPAQPGLAACFAKERTREYTLHVLLLTGLLLVERLVVFALTVAGVF